MKVIFLVFLFLSCVVVRANSNNQKQDSDCHCKEESENGYYCNHWKCDIDPDRCFRDNSFAILKSCSSSLSKDVIDSEDIDDLEPLAQHCIFEKVPLVNLQIGDCAVDEPVSDHCSLVTMISHREPEVPVRYFKVVTDNNITSYATPSHNIPIVNGLTNHYREFNLKSLDYVILNEVKVGDYIWTGFGIDKVKEKSPVIENGVNSIHTESGRILVDNTLYSSYSTVTHHTAHNFFWIYNMFRTYDGGNKKATPLELAILRQIV